MSSLAIETLPTCYNSGMDDPEREHGFRRLTSDTTDEFGVELTQPKGVRYSTMHPSASLIVVCLIVIGIAVVSGMDTLNRDEFPLVESATVTALVVLIAVVVAMRRRRAWQGTGLIAITRPSRSERGW